MAKLLIKPADLAKELGLPLRQLLAVAEKHGLIIQCGSAKRIRTDEIEKVLEACRKAPNQPASLHGKGLTAANQSFTSKTAPTNALQAP
jgi:hypothetical protein